MKERAETNNEICVYKVKDGKMVLKQFIMKDVLIHPKPITHLSI